MEDIYVVAIIVVACGAVIYMGLKSKLELILNNMANNRQAPQPAVAVQAPVAPAPVVTQTVVPYQGAPQVTVSGPMQAGDEIAAVAMAAIQAYESEMATDAEPAVYVAGSAGDAMAPVLKVRKTRKKDNLWVATARYESHKAL